MIKQKTISELNQLYQESDTASSELFTEQKNNLLLVNGQHYTKQSKQFHTRVREDQRLPNEQKLRLVKNHVQKISKTYKNNIGALSPGVIVSPKTATEMDDVKSADQHNSVWADIKERHKMKAKMRNWISDFVDIGEMIGRVGYDYDAGRLLGYEAVLDEQGQPVLDENGEPQSTPKMSGDHTFERIFGFNCLVQADALTFEESPYVITRKMAVTKDLQARYKDDEKKLKMITETPDERYKVFNGATASYRDPKGQTMVREFFFRKCADYPNGYYYMTCAGGVLEEMELPLGLFPIVYAGFDEAATLPRAYSVIKQIRPYQAEINRTASKIAEHQITLGDDKLVLIGGSKIAHGGTAHGVKAINVTGSAPVVIPGRAGDQFVGYMQSQIQEMYQAAGVEEDSEPNPNSTQQPYDRLYQSIKQKKKVSLYTDKVEGFQVEICNLALRFAKEYYNDDQIIPAIGRKDQVNIPEFKTRDDLGVKVIMEPSSDDVDTRFGKQLALNHLIQFVGPQLDRSDLGHLMKNMPYGVEGTLEDATMDSENATNDILALDRGEQIPVYPEDNHDYMLKKLSNRMKKRDFQFLPPPVQQNYDMQRNLHRQALQQQQQQAAMLTAGYWPTGGYLVGCDMFVEVGDGKAPKRARIPYEALKKLLDVLDQQGTSQKSLHDQSLNDQAGMGAQAQPAVADQPAPVSNGNPGMGANQPSPGPPVN